MRYCVHSLFAGSLFVTLLFHGQMDMDLRRRMILFGGLSAVCVAGTLLLLFLRRASTPDGWSVPHRSTRTPTPTEPQQEIERSGRHSSKPDMQVNRQTAASGRCTHSLHSRSKLHKLRALSVGTHEALCEQWPPNAAASARVHRR